MPKIANKTAYMNHLKTLAEGSNIVTRAQCLAAAHAVGLKYPPAWFVQDKSRSAGRGCFFVDVRLAKNTNTVQTHVSTPISIPAPTMMNNNTDRSLQYALASATNGERTSLVPDVNADYVPWGHYEDIKRILETRIFSPILITGNTGNGKTEMVEQICARLKRECFRVNITEMTDEDELIGSWKLVDGSMTWQDGPVVLALRRGAVLLLDEIDLGTAKTMCLQSTLEGKGCFIKKINEKIPNSDGFNIIATANTKGKGSDDGRFVGTRVMNEAMLDRFDYTYEQDYAPRSVEKKILLKAMKRFGKIDEHFADCLSKWTESIRKGFLDGSFTEIVSTRRVINICKAYAMFGCKQKAISMSLTRFDKDTQTAYLSFYNKIDGTDLAPNTPKTEVKEEASTDTPVPF